MKKAPLLILTSIITVAFITVFLSDPISIHGVPAEKIHGEVPSRVALFQTVELPELKIDHYTFNGWYDKNSGEQITRLKWDLQHYFGYDIYADVRSEQYNVIFKNKDGEVIGETEYSYETGGQLPVACSDSKYFVGWVNESGEVVKSIMPHDTGNKEMTALFAEAMPEKNQTCDIYTGDGGTIRLVDESDADIYNAQLVYSDDQNITDDPGKANDFFKKNLKGRNVEIICDHASDGFKTIMTSNKAFIKKNGIEKEYRCLHRHQGYNEGDDLLLMNNKSALNQYDDADIVMYTCNDDEGHSISITYWAEIK